MLGTLALFVCVRNLPWKESKLDGVILKVAGAAFGVYLIHDNYLIRYLVWDTFRVSKVAKTHWAMIYAVVVAAIVYLTCTLLELLRQQLVKWFAPIWEKTLLYRKEQNLYLKITKRVNDPS